MTREGEKAMIELLKDIRALLIKMARDEKQINQNYVILNTETKDEVRDDQPYEASYTKGTEVTMSLPDSCNRTGLPG